MQSDEAEHCYGHQMPSLPDTAQSTDPKRAQEHY